MPGKGVTVDLVTELPNEGGFALVLVEQGPWSDTQVELRRMQDRLHGCVDLAVFGGLAQQFPESQGRAVLIRLDCYNLALSCIDDFFSRFTAYIESDGETQSAIRNQSFVRSVTFELNHRQLDPDG
jgi:hypothetical protein